MGKFLNDGTFRRSIHAIHAVEPLAHAIGNRCIAIIRKHRAPGFCPLAEISNDAVVLIVESGHSYLPKRPREGVYLSICFFLTDRFSL